MLLYIQAVHRIVPSFQKFDHFLVNKTNCQIGKLSNNSKIPNTTNRKAIILIAGIAEYNVEIIYHAPKEDFSINVHTGTPKGTAFSNGAVSHIA